MGKFRIEGQEVLQLVNYLANKYNVKLIVSSSYLDKKIYMNLDDTDIDTVIKMIARILNTKIIKENDVYYIGELRDEDQSYFVGKVSKFDKEDLLGLIQTFSTEKGRATVTNDGLVVVSDSQEVISRLVSFLYSLENIFGSVWFVQLLISDLSDTSLNKLGIQSEYLLEATQFLGSGNKFDSSGFFKGVLKLDTNKGKRTFKNSVSFLVKDGSEASFKLGGQYPVRKPQTVKETGNIIEDVEFIDVGQIFNVSLRDYSDTSAKLKLNLSIIDVLSTVGDLPILGKREFINESIYNSEGVYLVGSLDHNKLTFDKKGHIMPILFDKSTEENRLRIFLRIYKISGFYKDK